MMTIPQTSGKELLNTTDYKSLKPNLSRSKISEIGSLKVVTVAVWNKMHWLNERMFENSFFLT